MAAPAHRQQHRRQARAPVPPSAELHPPSVRGEMTPEYVRAPLPRSACVSPRQFKLLPNGGETVLGWADVRTHGHSWLAFTSSGLDCAGETPIAYADSLIKLIP